VGMFHFLSTGRKEGVAFLLFAVVFSVALILSCGGDDEGPAGTVATGTPVMDGGADVLLADGADAKGIVAYVTSENGIPLWGIPVQFSTTYGSVTASDVSDNNGRVDAVLTSVYSASDLEAQVCASIPDNVDSSALAMYKQTGPLAPESVRRTASIAFIAGRPGGEDVILTASDLAELAPGKAARSSCITETMRGITASVEALPPEIPADGVSHTALRVVVKETTRGVPVVNALLGFSASDGLIEALKETNEEGVAVASLTSTVEPDTASVQVLIGGAVAAQTTVPFTQVSMELSADPWMIDADGRSQSTVTAVLLSKDRSPLAGVPVAFSTDLGVVSSPVVTDGNGRAAAMLTSAAESGVAHVVARFAALVDTIQVAFGKSFLPASLALTVNPAAITADGASTASLRAVVLDSTQAPVPDGTPVLFEILSGEGVLPGLVETAGGEAAALLTSGTAVGAATVRASVSGVADTITVRYVAGAPGRISLAADPAELLGNGSEMSVITATAKDLFGNAVTAGWRIAFEASRGEIETSALTDSMGVAEVEYTAGFGAGPARITATAEGLTGEVSGQITLTLFSGAPTAILLDSLRYDAINVQGSGDPEAATMVFRLYDANGVPIAGDRPTEVAFELVATTDGGGEYLYREKDTTDAWGRVRTTLNSGTRPGVTETIASIVGSSPLVESQVVPVAIRSFLPHPDHLTIAADTLNIAGLCYVGWTDTMYAYVYDQFSNPVTEGTAVYFSTNYGGVTGSDVTDSLGVAKAIFTSQAPHPYPTEGLVTITAQTADSLGNRITAQTNIRLSTCLANISVDPETFTIGNGEFLSFTYEVSDAYGNPLMAGTHIEVTTTNGALAGDIDFYLPDVISGHTTFQFYLGDANTGEEYPPDPTFVTITVTGPNGNGAVTAAGTID